MSKYTKILIAAILIIFASIGLGRFSYGMILPDLQSSLAISTTQAGFIGTANFIGYLIAIFFVSSFYKKYSSNLLISISLFLQALSMFMMTLFSNYLIISFFYSFSGFFAAISNVSIMIYIAHIIPSHMKGKALGIVVTGIGFSIIFSGFMVPLIESFISNEAWKISWILFGVLVFCIALFVKIGLPNDTSKQAHHAKPKTSKELFQSLKFYKIALLYLLFGITYVVYVTFFVTASIEKYQISTHEAGYFWSVLGTMSLLSGPCFGYLSDKIGTYKTFIIIYIFLSISYVLIALNLHASILWVSAVLFGLSAWAVPSLITVLSTQEFSIENTAKVFSLATLVFSAGQIIGPLGAGYLYDIYNSFSNVFILCALLTSIAAIIALVFSINHQKMKMSQV